MLSFFVFTRTERRPPKQGWEPKFRRSNFPPLLISQALLSSPISGLGPCIQFGVTWSDILRTAPLEGRLTERHGYHGPYRCISPRIKGSGGGSAGPGG